MEKTRTTFYRKYGIALRYLIVGGLTTVINIGLFFGLTHLSIPWFWVNIAAWLLSVLFAFAANKTIVFGSANMTLSRLLKEGLSFFTLRGASLGADTLILFVGLTLMNGAPVLVKLIDQVVVIALNYVFSKHIFA